MTIKEILAQLRNIESESCCAIGLPDYLDNREKRVCVVSLDLIYDMISCLSEIADNTDPESTMCPLCYNTGWCTENFSKLHWTHCRCGCKPMPESQMRDMEAIHALHDDNHSTDENLDEEKLVRKIQNPITYGTSISDGYEPGNLW